MSSITQSSPRASRWVFWGTLLLVAGLLVERYVTLYGFTQVPARVVACEGKWVETSQRTSGGYRKDVVYYPVAETESGMKAQGKVLMPTRNLCSQTVGNRIEVLIDPNNPQKKRIYSFIQFWAISLFFALFFLWSLIAILSRRVAPAAGILMLGFFAWQIAQEMNYVGGEPIEPNAEEQGAAQHQPGIDAQSSRALNRCVWQAKREQNVESRSQITKLVCQGQKIKELSAIEDLVSLKELYLQNNQLVDLQGLAPFTQLKVLSVGGNKTLQTTSGIELAPSIEEFYANRTGLKDLKGLDSLPNLRILQAIFNDIRDIAVLGRSHQLQELYLSYNDIADLAPLANKPHLAKLQISANQFKDISPLFGNLNMVQVLANSEKNVPCEQFQILKSKLSPNAKVHLPEGC
ncbi:Internalin-A precursor [Grimontia celer]|uniref:Internalin-A n=1 Tax=Grimontia celer TaxID=1796497 RepID=A0A128ESR1_9GAMM|nr:leucine-rich repeat domain-containing protein [Grimontia celer]CZF77609.1 Internalin-A precursor [Grimontia celer]